MFKSLILTGPITAALCAMAAVTFFTLNDVSIKLLSGGYALHQIMLIRSAIGILVLLMVFMPLIEDCRRSNAARLASVRAVEHHEDRVRGDDGEDDEQVVSEEVDDDEAADIKRLRDKRSKIEGGTISSAAIGIGAIGEESIGTASTERHARKLGI